VSKLRGDPHSHRTRALLNEHGLTPSRALGQNFVVDPNTVRRIARLADVGPGDQVLEIGAGLGSLTLALAETGRRRARPGGRPLSDRAAALGRGSHTASTVHHANALDADYAEILQGPPRPVVVANLPYNVATPVVLHLLESEPLITRMLVMVQKRRASDSPLTPVTRPTARSSLARPVLRRRQDRGQGASPTVFLPKPNVDSVLVSLVRRDHVRVDPGVVSEAELFEVIRTAFGQRRKMLRRSLAPEWSATGSSNAPTWPRPDDPKS
jgi:16S rRNA (adenine1518-N6/adenine1519-N6)-dimethyltransferase